MAYAMLVNPIEKGKPKMSAAKKKEQNKAKLSQPVKRNPVVIHHGTGKVVDMAKAKKKRKKNPDAMRMMAAEMTGGAVVGVGAMIGMDWAQTFVPIEYVAKVDPRALPLIKGGIVTGVAVLVAKLAKNRTVKTVAASAAVTSAGVAMYDTAQAMIAKAAADNLNKPAAPLKGGNDTLQTDYNWDFSQSAVTHVGAPMRAPMRALAPLPANGPLPSNAPLGAAMFGMDEMMADVTGNY